MQNEIELYTHVQWNNLLNRRLEAVADPKPSRLGIRSEKSGNFITQTAFCIGCGKDVTNLIPNIFLEESEKTVRYECNCEGTQEIEILPEGTFEV